VLRILKKHLLFDRSSKLVQMSVSYLFPVPCSLFPSSVIGFAFLMLAIAFSVLWVLRAIALLVFLGFESNRIFGVVGFESDRFSVL
jgi:hypothetical protein